MLFHMLSHMLSHTVVVVVMEDTAMVHMDMVVAEDTMAVVMDTVMEDVITDKLNSYFKRHHEFK